MQYFICFFKRSCKQLKSYSLFRETNVRAIYHPPDPSNIFEVLNYSESKTDSIKNAMPKFEWPYNANKVWNKYYRVPSFQKKMPKVYRILNAEKCPNETELFIAT